jgi:phosphoserine aminotransferase
MAVPDRFRILITGGGATTAVSALKGLRLADVRV